MQLVSSFPRDLLHLRSLLGFGVVAEIARELLLEVMCSLSLSQLEVSQLEGSLQQPKAQCVMSPYLVPDTQALCQHLGTIRQLAASGRFIVIIPRTGT